MLPGINNRKTKNLKILKSGSLKAKLFSQIPKARIQQGRVREDVSLWVGTDSCPLKQVPMRA